MISTLPTRHGMLLRFTPLVVLTIVLLGGALHTVQTLSAFRQAHDKVQSTSSWMVSQAEVEGLRFLTALDRFALGDATLDRAELTLRFEIFWSRLAVMQNDPLAVLRQAAGADDLIARSIATLAAIETDLRTFEPGDAITYQHLRARSAALLSPLHQLALDIIHRANQHPSDEALERVEHALLFLLTGGALTGALLAGLLVRSVVKAERLRAVAEHEHRKAAEMNVRLETTNASLSEALDAAAAASQVKSQFLATMSHELRTPLNAVIGFADLMRGEPYGPLGDRRYADYIADIHHSGTHLLSLINDILDLSKLEAGRVELREETIFLSEAVAAALRLIGPQAAAAGIRLHSDTPPHLPQLRADAVRLRQILLNLLSNAVKFTPRGGKVHISVASGSAGLQIVIADTGIGLAPEDIPKAFAPFGQIDNRLARKYEGTGLGLPLTKHLVELHDASIQLESAVGVGTSVTVTFPSARVVDDTRHTTIIHVPAAASLQASKM